VKAVELGADQTHDLRRRVLRGGDPGASVVFEVDADPATVHLGLTEDGTVVAVSTWAVRPAPTGGGRGVQLRGMAVEPGRQGHGLGRVLVRAGVARAREHGAAVVWASARDTALGFYRREGFAVVGEGYVPSEVALAHHLVTLRLEP